VFLKDGPPHENGGTGIAIGMVAVAASLSALLL
jgi:hypothetical protein